MALSEGELSFLRLLERTKKLSRDDLSKNVWIVKASATHLTSLLSQMQDEKRTYNSEVLMQYGREVNQLTMLVEAEQKKKVEDRLAAVEQIPSRFMDFSDQKAATTSQESSSEVRLRNKSVYRADLRQQLLGEDRRRQAGGNLASHVEDVSRHEQMHEDLANELLNMTKSLKMNMKIAGDVIRDDNQRLGKMSQQVDSNKERLQAESTRLAHHAYKCGFDCFIIFLFLFIFWSFISMSTSSQKDDWLSKMLPSQAFLKNHVRFPVHKERLSNRITELHIFHDNLLSGRSMPVLDDSSWLTFFRMHNPEERVRYLLELSPVESTAVVNDGRLISERNEERHSKGEMVYAPGYNSIWELQGGDFRRKLDTMFVSRLLAQKRADSSLPKLILDCRFMREFSVAIQNKFAKQINNAHNSNWNIRIPFNMSIANFSADSQLSDIVKRSWLFRYGPPSSRENFQSNSFYPSISARSITEVADCAPESIMYISSRATEFLPEEPPADVGAVVICASHDIQSWSSSLSAAKKDGIRAYRIPFQRHSIIESGQKTSYLFPELIPILSAYFSGNDIGEPIRSAISASLTPRKGSVREETEFVEKYKAACKSLELEQSRQQKYQQWLTRPAKPRVHRYSREERRQRQAA